MRITQDLIESLAGRIERAYRLRRGEWNSGCSTSRVWAAAALTLLRAHGEHPELPLDPELYVAVQPRGGTFIDPWGDLAQDSSVRRYRRWIRRIVRGLESELRGEVKWAEGQVGTGDALEVVLSAESTLLSPLGRYIVAQRAGRADLAKPFLAGVLVQHRSCPLYRQAFLRFLPAESYPEGAGTGDARVPAPALERAVRSLVLLN